MQIVAKTASRNSRCIAILVIFMIGNYDKGCAVEVVVFLQALLCLLLYKGEAAYYSLDDE